MKFILALIGGMLGILGLEMSKVIGDIRAAYVLGMFAGMGSFLIGYYGSELIRKLNGVTA